jgi:hypothetical protein
MDSNLTIEVSKSARTLTVFDGGKPVKTYPCCTGRAAGDKEREGDCKTPDGVFYVCYKNPHSQYTLSLGLSYPNKEHAARGLKGGLITREQYDQFVRANDLTAALSENSKDMLPKTEAWHPVVVRADGVVMIDGTDWETLWKTPLGGEVMIHGGGGAARDGTAGCVGLDDADIAELYAMTPIGTPVVIRP